MALLEHTQCEQAEIAYYLAADHRREIHGMDPDGRDYADLTRAFHAAISELIASAEDAGVEKPAVAIREAADAGRLSAEADLEKEKLKVVSGAPEPIRDVLAEIVSLGDSASAADVGAAMEPLRTGKRPGRNDWFVSRELLISAVKATKAVSAPARFVDGYLHPAQVHDAPPSCSAPGDDAPGDWPEWPDGVPLARNRYGETKPTLGNCLLYIRYYPGIRGRLRHNERWLRPEWSGRTPWKRDGRGPGITEEDAVEAASYISSAEGVGFGRDAMLGCFAAEAHQHPCDEVREYLDGLQWDGHRRVDAWLTTYFGADQTPYTEAIGRAWLISAVARALDPGCQVDHMLILEGAQGILKSSALRALAGDTHFADVSLDPGDKDSIQSIHGPWIVEWSELAGLSKREAEALKAFVSRRTDRFRPPYGRHMQDLPRRCVFAGSTNERTYLNDPTGGRRYWPVKTVHARPEAIARDRDQLWAEAVAYYRDGVQWWLDGDMEAEAVEQQQTRLIEDTWDDKIVSWLDANVQVAANRFVPTVSLLSALDLPSGSQTTGTARRLASVMRRLGWEPGRGPCDADDPGSSRVRGYSLTGSEEGIITDVGDEEIPF